MNKNLALNEISKCKNVKEVIALAKSNNYKLSKEKAIELFNQTHGNHELNDEELNNVSGGACGFKESDKSNENCYKDVHYETGNSVKFIFNPPQSAILNAKEGPKEVIVDFARIGQSYYNNRFCDVYHVQGDKVTTPLHYRHEFIKK